MVLKRKRSISELSSPASSTTSTFSVSSPIAFPLATPMANAPHLPSRTLKRVRDSRPSDDEVHRKFYEWRAHHRSETGSSHVVAPERTLGLLYSAQRQPPLHAASPSPAGHFSSEPTNTMGIETQAARAQRSLHSFWAISSAPSSVGSTPSVGMDVATACDDCGADLPGFEADAMDMDGGPKSACGPCGKNVCGHCSVTNVDGQTRCLQCAGRKVWVGGLGWTTAPGVAIC